LRLNHYDECDYDKYIQPYYTIEKALEGRMRDQMWNRVEGAKFEPAVFNQNYERDEANARGQDLEKNYADEEMMQDLTVKMIDENKRRPELLIDEATKNFLLENPDQNNMFNLTLSNF
jgi:hypothetical protein